jgi:hypothetical protein
MGKRKRNGASQAACRASDQGDLPGEVKFGKIIHRDCSAPSGFVR